MSTSYVHIILRVLHDRGYIYRLPNRARAIQLIERKGHRFAVFRFDEESKDLRPVKSAAG